MNWHNLNTPEDLKQIIQASHEKPQAIFKHSTRCSISSMAKNRLDRSNVPDGIDFIYLDLIAHRDISNTVAETFDVPHESPQILVIKNGECIFDESHSSISMNEILEQAGIGI